MVAVGRFGHGVARDLEDRANEIADVIGASAVRNFATLRILTELNLAVAAAEGFHADDTRARGLWFPEPPPGSSAPPPFGGAYAVAGLRPSPADTARLAHVVFDEELTALVAMLFRVDRFVDYQPDVDRYPSRLDVVVVGAVDDPLNEAVQCHVQRAFAELCVDRLAPLFRPHHSNLAITHLVAFPLVARADAKPLCRSLVSRYRAELEEARGRIRSIPARFLFMEDRSFRYIVAPEQMRSVFVSYVHLLAFRRGQDRRLLRDLVQLPPAIDRLRGDDDGLNRLCGTFGQATIEAPIHRIVRYCRNRQSIGLLNVYLGRPQDGEAATLEERPIAQSIRDLLGQFGDRGTVEAEIEAYLASQRAELEAERKDQAAREGIGDWGLHDVKEWEYHGDIVETFHDDLDGRGSPKYTSRWLSGHIDRMVKHLDYLRSRYLVRLFDRIEAFGASLSDRIARADQGRVDEMIAAEPAGWKDALAYLESALREVEGRIAHWSAKVESSKLRPPSTEPFKRAREALDALTAEVDLKPVEARVRRVRLHLGLAAGVSAGVLVTCVLPLAILGVGWAVPPAVAAAIPGAWWLLRRYNAEVLERIQGYVAAETGCVLRQRLDEAAARLFPIDVDTSWVGERVRWSCDLWRVRIWRRIRIAIQRDIERLRDVGSALEAQLLRFREDQESIGVRFRQRDGVVGEDHDRVLATGDVFWQSLLASESLDGIHLAFYRPAVGFANRHLEEEQPFADWRAKTPFADWRALADYGRGPFLPVLTLDLFTFPPTREVALRRLSEFLGDFAHKLSIHADWATRGRDVGEDRLMLLNEAVEPHFRQATKNLEWPSSWTLETGLADRHAVLLLRHVQGLAPWELASLGSPAEVVSALIERGSISALAGIMESLPSLPLRLAMMATALSRLGVGDLEGSRRLLKAWRREGEDGVQPIDGALYAPVVEAAAWVSALAGEPALLGLVCTLYGTRVEGGDDAFAAARARADLLVLAAEGQADWAWRALNELPPDWIHPMVSALVQARTAVHLVLQRRDDEALGTVRRLSPEALRAATLLEVAIAFLKRGEDGRAAAAVGLARPPDGSDSLPTVASPPFDAIEDLAVRLAGTDGLGVAIAAVYGSRTHRELDVGGLARRYLALRAASTGEDAASLLRMLMGFPRGTVDPMLLDEARRSAA